MAERDLDVVVLGATGVTGRQVAGYLAARCRETGARWAVAGRDPGRLRAVLAGVGVTAPETLTADVAAPASLTALAARTRVVLNLVGPYTRLGRPVIEACVAAGTHYADLTGEIPFVRTVVDEVHERAADSGVKVVQTCGFESLPPDLAVALAVESARRRWDEPLASVDLELSWTPPPGLPRPSDAISGGTFQSLVAMTAADQKSGLAVDPAALVPDPADAAEVRRRSPVRVRPRRGDAGAVLAPMAPGAFLNPAVVHRSAALSGSGFFAYREGVALSGPAVTLPLRACVSGALSVVQVGLRATSTAPTRVRRGVAAGLGRVLPSSGFGPRPDRLEGWHWRMAVDARTAGGASVRVDVEAEGHPGYLATARMLGEAGLLLAEDGPEPGRGGCLTPALALGTARVDRFEHARVRFAVRA